MENFRFLILGALLLSCAGMAFAEETIGEKMSAGANGAKRAAKKGVHRVAEALCTKGDLKCAAEKIGHRAEEIKDSAVDGAEKLKNKID